MPKWTKVAAAVFAVIAILLLTYAIFAEEPPTDEHTSPGMGDQHVYSSTNLVIIVISSFLIAIAVMFILMREEYEPLPPTMKPRPPPPPDDPGKDIDRPTESRSTDRTETVPDAADITTAGERRETYLILRLLTGDERRMFKAVMDAGGEALQKDLIKTTKMSNAKVSRVLDRLQEKGVVTKERHGSTNKVKISVNEG
ncbi:MAG: hypothetical protein JSV94_05270 [Methanobacteriota archaeon]|nr:MAG: hypothetical protein JSV94_05270 [Euryarchaeota archaeon]